MALIERDPYRKPIRTKRTYPLGQMRVGDKMTVPLGPDEPRNLRARVGVAIASHKARWGRRHWRFVVEQDEANIYIYRIEDAEEAR